ncbi:MAG: hypothetical protein KGI73_01900 [Patescibacteria group bacterium]|nr:hypothetical protein [Patescibacteria group bacterium]
MPKEKKKSQIVAQGAAEKQAFKQLFENIQNQIDQVSNDLDKAKEVIQKQINEAQGLQGQIKDAKDEVEKQKNYLMLGFFVLAIMVVALIAQFSSEKVSADYELIHSIDLLNTQMATSSHMK